MARHVITLYSENLSTPALHFFVDIVGGELRIRSAAKWDMKKGCFIEAPFDVVTQTIVE